MRASTAARKRGFVRRVVAWTISSSADPFGQGVPAVNQMVGVALDVDDVGSCVLRTIAEAVDEDAAAD
jgi:hypothetical protein